MTAREYDEKKQEHRKRTIQKNQNQALSNPHLPSGIHEQDNSFGMPISSTITRQQVVAADSIPSNTGRIRTPNIQIPANLGNLGVKLRQQITTPDVGSKGIGDEHVQKENSHTTEDRIKDFI